MPISDDDKREVKTSQEVSIWSFPGGETSVPSQLATKQFTTNIIGMNAGKPEWQQQQHQPNLDPAGGPDIVCVSPDKKTKETWPSCHAYGK